MIVLFSKQNKNNGHICYCINCHRYS